MESDERPWSVLAQRILLVGGVVVLVGGLAWARHRFLRPEMVHRAVEHRAHAMESVLRNGDVLIQASSRRGARMFGILDHSRWNHCAMAFARDGRWEVLDALDSVRWVPLRDWLAEGQDLEVEIRRLAAATPGQQVLLEQAARARGAKGPDTLLGWSDSSYYGAELVWKVHQAAGIALGGPGRFADLDTHQPVVKDLLQRRRQAQLDPGDTLVTPHRLRIAPEFRLQSD